MSMKVICPPITHGNRDWGWSDPLRFLRTLELGSSSETEGLLQLEISSNIEGVRIAYCERLEKLSKNLSNLMCLKVLKLDECPKLVSISVNNLPPTLRSLKIKSCKNLQCVLDDRKNINFNSKSLLVYLEVKECEGLKLLSASCKLPTSLETLKISWCPSLESIAREFGDNMCLKEISLDRVQSIKYLPQGLDKLHRLQYIWIQGCENLVCFPESGLPTTPILKSLSLTDCEKLEALPSLHSLQLEDLSIRGCPRVKSNSEGGLRLPTTLSSLEICGPNISEAVMEWGRLHTLTSLRRLTIDGGNCTETASFPQSQEETGMNMSMKLPSSLPHLSLIDFKNLRKLSSNGFQNLTSLQYLSIWHCPNLKSLPQNLTSLQSLSIIDCPNLKSLPKKQMIPSLLELRIFECPELKKRCKRDKGKLWSNISHVPYIIVDWIQV